MLEILLVAFFYYGALAGGFLPLKLCYGVFDLSSRLDTFESGASVIFALVLLF